MTQRTKAQNASSILLQDHENDALFQVMGRLSVTLATGVVQLYLADQSDRNRWSKRCCGVACFVKDSSKRSFFIRVYDIKKQQMIWEQELYNQFIYKTPREYFHTFEADNCQAGMNFASEDEAAKFKKAIEGKLSERRAKRQERKRQTVAQKHGNNRAPESAPPARMGQSAAPASQPLTTLNVDLGRNNNNTSNTSTLKKDKDKKNAAKKKLTKADIGTPSNFVHVSHVGWDPDKGFDMNNLDPDMQTLFQSVGISAEDNVDKETVDFIYDFVEKHGGIDAVKKELKKSSGPPPPPPSSSNRGPPPPPSRTPGAPPPPSRSALPPPPPPSRNGPPPRATAPPPPPSRAMPAPPRAPAAAPPPPPPSMSAPPPPPPSMGPAPPPPPPPPTGGPPPPPPPPPPPMEAPAGGGAGGRGALMDAIRSGANLKHAETNSEPPKSVDSRGQLLDAIRQGANLKKVETNEKSASTPTSDTDGLVGALARALANRQKQIHGSDDEDDDDDDEDDGDDDDDEWDD